MKAAEVLSQYAAGKRDFRGENLQGQNFKGKDLSGADFSECDIRGTNFKEANLTGVKFIGITAGLQIQSKIFLLLLSAMLLVAISGIFSGWTVYYISWIFESSDIRYRMAGWMALATLAIFIFTTYCKGLVTGAVSVAVAVSGFLAGFGAVAVTVAFTVVVAVAVAGFGAVAGAVAVAGAGSVALAVVVVVVGSVALAVARAGAFAFAGPFDEAVAGSVAVALTLLAYLISYRSIKGDVREAWLRDFAVAFASYGGTNFSSAIVIDADFTGATLKNTDLRAKSLTRTRFEGAINLELARVGNTLLSQPAVRDLLIDPNMGYKKNYFKANLRGANLDHANLKEANLTQADLSEATLQNADLRDTNLSQVNAVNTNFTHVYLTGACLEGWNIDSTTILDNIDCQYVYFVNNKQERRPSIGDFKPGEFSKLFKEVLDSIVLIFHNGVNWKAFASAFKQVQVKNEETPLNIESIEDKGDGMVVIKVRVSPEADKAKIQQEIQQEYEDFSKRFAASHQKQLTAKDQVISIQNKEVNSLENIIDILAANMSDDTQNMKTVHLLENGKDIEQIEEQQNLIQGQIPNNIVQQLHQEYKKTKKLIEEKYEAILEANKATLESKQIQLEEKQQEINYLREELLTTKRLNLKRIEHNNNNKINE